MQTTADRPRESLLIDDVLAGRERLARRLIDWLCGRLSVYEPFAGADPAPGMAANIGQTLAGVREWRRLEEHDPVPFPSFRTFR